MKITLSKRLLVVVLIVVLVLSVANTILILDQRQALQDAEHDAMYDYVVFQESDTYKAKNQATGKVDFNSADAATVINQALAEGNTLYLKHGDYALSADVQVNNKINAKIIGDAAIIIGNSQKIVVKGDNYALSQNNMIQGLTVINGTLRIENSFGTTVSNVAFLNCTTALELANSNTWTEGTKIENCRFVNSRESIAFKTPTGNGTGSYASTQISRCYFNIPDNSAGIIVEYLAEFSDSQLQELRMWMGENGSVHNQTGLLLNGSMHQTVMSGIVFESFTDYPDQLYAMDFGETTVTPPALSSGISFLGNWTAKINNPYSIWISGTGASFKQEEMGIQVGVNGEYGSTREFQLRPDTISSFKPEIQVEGSFARNEVITVRFRLEFIDNTISRSVEKTFTNTTSIWLSDDDMLRLFPSQSIIWAILVDAKANSASTDATVQISIYGTIN